MRIPESELFKKVRLETNSDDCHVSCHNDFFILFKLLVSWTFKRSLIVGQTVLYVSKLMERNYLQRNRNTFKFIIVHG